jgi:spore photoproduct lyase
LITKTYSHIYIEKEAENYPAAKRIKDILKYSRIIEINHYKDVFSERGQSYLMQKNRPKLILAVKRENFIYKGSPMCNNYGYGNFYYSSAVMNCPYNCGYCYLRGMYPSGNIVVFVNIEDILECAAKLSYQKPFICASYDTDLLAMEKLLGFAGKWIEFCRQNPEITVEMRTKSANFGNLASFAAPDNFILAVTLSPNEIIDLYEHKTPGLGKRLGFINAAAKSGWKVRICLDPVLYVRNYAQIYGKFISEIFASVSAGDITDVSFGVLRLPGDFAKRAAKNGIVSELFAYPFVNGSAGLTYTKEHSEKLSALVYNGLLEYLPRDKIFSNA